MKIGLKILAVALAAFLVVACDKGEKGETPASNDGWMMTKWAESTAMAGKVYLQLNGDNTFALYQSIDKAGFKKFTGTYTISQKTGGSTITGVYSDGKKWKDEYSIVTRNESVLNLKALSDDTVAEYAAVVVPAYVKDGVVGNDSRAEIVPFL